MWPSTPDRDPGLMWPPQQMGGGQPMGLLSRQQPRGGLLGAGMAPGAGGGLLRPGRPVLGALGNNANALLMMGMGMLSGQGNKDAWGRGAQGFAAGSGMDMSRRDERRLEEKLKKEAEQEAKRQAALAKLSGGGFPEWDALPDAMKEFALADDQFLRSVMGDIAGKRLNPPQAEGRYADEERFGVPGQVSPSGQWSAYDLPDGGEDIVNAGDGNLYNKRTGEWITAPDQAGGGDLFDSKSIEGQGLNYLVRQGRLTHEQAANVAAGKQITGASGELIFMTPEGIFQQLPGAGAPEPVVPGAGVGQVPGVQPGQDPNRIQLTPPKPPVDALNQARQAESAFNILDQELDGYQALIKEKGAAVFPWTAERDQLQQARRNIQLQLKELYNLGVLNGPDLALMNKMLFDPTIEGGGIFGTQNRATTSIDGLRVKLRNVMEERLRQVGRSPAGPGQSREELINRYGLEP